MDKEHLILDAISNSAQITQRELSKKTGLSLGTINILLTKMTKEGLIKVKQIPVNRVLYILTPEGMAEKVNKTYNYIKRQYQYINNTVEKISSNLNQISRTYKNVCIILENDELDDLIKIAASNLSQNMYRYDVWQSDNQNNKHDKTIIVTNTVRYIELKEKGYSVINLLERL